PLSRTGPPPSPPLGVRLRGSFSQTGRTMGMVWRSSPKGTTALALLTVVSALLGPSIAYTGKLIVDAVVAARGAHAAGSHALTYVWIELGLIVASGLIERTLGLVRQL